MKNNSSVDANYSTSYVYGQDGQRSNKYTQNSETLYFNKMWTLHTDSGNTVYGGQTAKNIYLGETRIVTKLNGGNDPTYQEEYYKQYFYHSDHLGSASLISDYNGDEYQRIEYTPYGETWVEKTSNTGMEYLPYKFTAKELDEETGLYYYGARYLDPKYSRWISTDPALGEYIPAAGKGTAGKLPGMGGVFNAVNLNLYHYAANNPVKYTDPDGRVSGAPDFYFAKHINDEIGDRAKKFNSEKYIDNTNCAAWAFNLDKKFGTEVFWEKGVNGGYQPGKDKNNNRYKTASTLNEYISGMESALQGDGFKLTECSKDEKISDGQFKISLATVKTKTGFSYHFLRQEKDGQWTQKGGCGSTVSSISNKLMKVGTKIDLAGLDNFTVQKFYKVEKIGNDL